MYGSIEDAGDVDFFSFRAWGGREYVIETHLGTNPDTFLTLYNRAGDIIDQHDDSGSGGGERMVWVAPSTGTYYIEVKGYNSGATGTYYLTLTEAVIGSSRQGGELRLALDADPFPDSFTQQLENLSLPLGARQVHSLIFSRLWIDGVSGVERDLVQEWDLSRDHREWTVRLRRDARFHDGRPVTAHDVAYSFELFGPFLTEFADVSAIDDHTLRISFEEPYPGFVSLMAQYDEAIVVPRGMLDLPINSFTDLVGSGPFVPAEYRKNSYLVLERNPAYYEEGLPYLDAVRMVVIPERATRFAAFLTEQIDFLGYPRLLTQEENVTQEEHAQISKTYPDAAFGAYPAVIALWFDTQTTPFNDRRVRMAVNLAIDMERLFGAMWAGELQGTVPDALFPALHTALDEPEALSRWHRYDPEMARQLLAEAGYPDGFETELQFTARYSESWRGTAETFAEMLGQVGIYVALKEIDNYAEYRVAPAEQGMKIALLRDFERDVVRFFSEHFADGGTFNHSRTSMPVSGIDPANPGSILEAQAILNDMVYYIPLFVRSYARNERVHGPLPVQIVNLGVTLRQLWLDE